VLLVPSHVVGLADLGRAARIHRLSFACVTAFFLLSLRRSVTVCRVCLLTTRFLLFEHHGGGFYLSLSLLFFLGHLRGNELPLDDLCETLPVLWVLTTRVDRRARLREEELLV